MWPEKPVVVDESDETVSRSVSEVSSLAAGRAREGVPRVRPRGDLFGKDPRRPPLPPASLDPHAFGPRSAVDVGALLRVVYVRGPAVGFAVLPAVVFRPGSLRLRTSR